MISRKQWALIMLPFLLLVTFFCFALKKDLAIRSTPDELEFFRYTAEAHMKDRILNRRPPLNISHKISGPLYVENGHNVNRIERETTHSSAEKIYTLSLVLLSENDRRAIINNAFVREGDIFDNRKVSRIERDKVALTAKGVTTWLKLEEQ